MLALLRGITSNHNGNFYCLNCFPSCRTYNKLKRLEKVCHKHDYHYIKMPNESNKISKYIQGGNSLKAPFAIYSDSECLLKKRHFSQNNPEESYTEKKLNMSLQVGQCSQNVHLMRQKINVIIIEEEIKRSKDRAMEIIN